MFLIRFNNAGMVSTGLIDAITSHVAQGHLLRQSNWQTYNNHVAFQYSDDGGVTWNIVRP